MSFELTILGSSSALPTSKRFTAAHLLNINERFFLIDCGEGTQIQMRRNKLSPARINHIFISHLHGDHVFGLFGLISSLGLMGRKAVLNIYGPSSLEEMLHTHLDFFGNLPFQLRYHISSHDKLIFEDSKTTVHSISLKHRTETFGYIFREKDRLPNLNKSMIEKYNLGIEEIKNIKNGSEYISSRGEVVPNKDLILPKIIARSYAYISDTAYFPGIVDYIKGVDLLFHEATFLSEDAKLAKQTFHSTADQAASIARDAKVGKLLIGHFSTRYKNEENFIAEAQSIFPETVSVNDNDRFIVEQRRENDL